MTTSRPSVPYRISLGVGTGAMLQPLNSSMIAVALITIGNDLGIEAGISWLISGMYLATAVGAPIAGRLADRYGARRVFGVGLLVVGVGAAIGPLFPTLPGLIASRMLLGLGAASQFPAAMAIIRARAGRHDEDANRALGVLSISAQVSIALGPTVGGLLVTGLGWPAIFWVNLPLCAIAGAWVWFATEPDRPPAAGVGAGRAPIDLLGTLLFAVGLGASMLYLLSLAGGEPWWDEWWWLILAIGAGLGWVGWERRVAEPLVDLAVFRRQPQLGLVLLRQLLVSTAFFCVFYTLPQWLEEQRGLDPRGAGLLLMPIALVGAGSTVLATRLLRRGRPTLTLLVGSVGLLGGGLLLGLAVDSSTPFWLLVAVTAVLGVANGFNYLSNQNAVYALAADQVGSAAGLLRTAHFLGAMVAAGLIEVLSAGVYDDAGLHRIGLGVAATAGGLVAVILLGLRSPRPSA